MVAAALSNGVWFGSQIIAVSAFMSILSGKFGVGEAIFAGVFYTVHAAWLSGRALLGAEVGEGPRCSGRE
jgi:hypothetical protein